MKGELLRKKYAEKERQRKGGLILIHLVKLNLIFNDAEKI